MPSISRSWKLRWGDGCGRFVAGLEKRRFDLDGYLAGLTPVERGIAELIRRLAPRSQVDARLAVAVALVEITS
jgi:hypothetical protein